MADDIETQRRNFLLGLTNTAAAPAVTPPDPVAELLPMTSQVIRNTPALKGGPADVSQFPNAAEEYRQRNQQPGVPLDLEQGADSFMRVGLAFRRSRDNQLAYLRSKYGEDAVREGDSGELIFRVVDAKTGKPKDIQVDENKMSASDLIDLSGAAPEIVASIWAARRGRGPSPTILRRIAATEKEIVKTSLAGQAAGAAQDVAMDLADFGVGGVDVAEIGRERGKLLGADVATGNVFAPAAALFKWTRGPLHHQRGQLQFDALNAQEYFRKTQGIDVPLTTAESTGSPTFGRVEAVQSKRAGSSGVIAKQNAETDAQLRNLQARLVGVLPEDELLGQGAIKAIRSKVAPLETAVKSAQATAVEAAETAVQRQLTARTAARPELFPNEVGAAVRNRIVARRDVAKAKAEELYDAVKAAPGGTGKVFPTDELAADAAKILKKIPAAGDIPMKDWVDPDVVNRLNSLVALKGNKLSLSDLQGMRRDAYDSMPRMEGVPGRGAHYLGEIADTLTKAIDDGVKAMPTSELKTALEHANKFYKSQVVPYNRVGLTELFRGADEAGHIGDSAVALKLASNPDQFRIVKEVLGDKSPEFARLKRFVVDDLLQHSSDDVSGVMDADAFLKNIRDFRNNPRTREIAKDVLGDDVSKLVFSLSQASMAKGAKLDSKAVAEMIMSGKGDTTQIRKLMAAQEALDTAYKNRITKAVASGELGEETIRPSEFVQRVVSSPKIEHSEVVAMMDIIGKKDPALLDAIQRKTLQDMMAKASKPVQPGVLSERLGGNLQNASAEDLLSAKLQDQALIAKAKTVLGPELWQDLTEYTALRGARELKDQAFASAGGISSGMQISNLLERGPLKYMTQWGKDFIAANFLTNKPMRSWLTAIPGDTSKSWVGKRGYDAAVGISLMLAQPTVLRSVLEEFGDETAAGQFIDSAKASIGQFLTEQDKAAQTPQQAADFQPSRRNFLLGTNAPAQP